MKPENEITERLGSYLDELEKAVRSSSQFASEQAPMLIQEYLAWEWLLYSTLCGVCVFFLVMAFAVAIWNWNVVYKGKTRQKKIEQHGDVVTYLFLVLLILATMILGFGFHAAKVKIAPRVVVLEKIIDMKKELAR